MAKRDSDIPDVNKRKPNKPVLTPPQAAERERRRYIKRTGGLRKDLDLEAASIEELKQTIEERLKVLEKSTGLKPEDGWNEEIMIPGFESIIGQMPKAKPQALIEQQVISQAKTIEELTKKVEELSKGKKTK